MEAIIKAIKEVMMQAIFWSFLGGIFIIFLTFLRVVSY